MPSAKGLSKIVDKGSSFSPENAVIDPRDTAKYLLRVTAGPSYDASTHRPVTVNGAQSFQISSHGVDAKVKVRIRDYHGLPRESPATSAYFSHPLHLNDRYAISYSFVPKEDIKGDELIFGFDFDRPIRDRLPPGFKYALRFVTRVIDPGIYTDPYGDKPYLYAPALGSWYAFRIGEQLGTEEPEESLQITPKNHGDDENKTEEEEEGEEKERGGGEEEEEGKEEEEDNDVIEEGAAGSGIAVRESHDLPPKGNKRRKHFQDASNLASFRFEKGREYHADFYNPYLDFANFAVRLPIITIGVARYIDDKTHTLRYVLKNKRSGEVYLVVVFTLLFGDMLKDVLAAEGGTVSNSGPLDTAGDGDHVPGRSQEEPEFGSSDASSAVSEESSDFEQPSAAQAGLISAFTSWFYSAPETPEAVPGSSDGRTSEDKSRQTEREIQNIDDAKIEELLREKTSTA